MNEHRVLAYFYFLALLTVTGICIAACAPTPKQIVKTVPVEVPVYTRVHIDDKYLELIALPTLVPACDGYYCNWQTADLLDSDADAIDTCNARFMALRELDKKP